LSWPDSCFTWPIQSPKWLIHATDSPRDYQALQGTVQGRTLKLSCNLVHSSNREWRYFLRGHKHLAPEERPQPEAACGHLCTQTRNPKAELGISEHPSCRFSKTRGNEGAERGTILVVHIRSSRTRKSRPGGGEPSRPKPANLCASSPAALLHRSFEHGRDAEPPVYRISKRAGALIQ
jgi:hypothetical protein